MNGQDPWCYPGETAGDDSFLDMFGEYSTDDLFELVCRGGGGAGTLGQPPSEDVMAAWLYPIVSGEDHAISGDGRETDDRRSPAKEADVPSMAKEADVPAATDRMPGKDTAGDSSLRTKKEAGANRTRSSHYAGMHSISEKRRRYRITERLRTLQQLVPGCDKCDQASTLDQTIQYMKSLQQHVQAMSAVGCSMRPQAAAAALYPIEPPPAVATPMPPNAVRPGVVIGPPPMVRYGAMLPYPHYALMMPAAPLYPPATAAAPPPPPSSSGKRSRKGEGNREAESRDLRS